MKKVLALLLAMAMIFALAACGQSAAPAATAAPEAPAQEPAEEAADATADAPAEEPADKVELIVFAAASMTETLTKIKDMYEAENPGVTLTYNFDSSGTLKTQIQENR